MLTLIAYASISYLMWIHALAIDPTWNPNLTNKKKVGLICLPQFDPHHSSLSSHCRSACDSSRLRRRWFDCLVAYLFFLYACYQLMNDKSILMIYIFVKWGRLKRLCYLCMQNNQHIVQDYTLFKAFKKLVFIVCVEEVEIN